MTHTLYDNLVHDAVSDYVLVQEYKPMMENSADLDIKAIKVSQIINGSTSDAVAIILAKSALDTPTIIPENVVRLASTSLSPQLIVNHYLAWSLTVLSKGR